MKRKFSKILGIGLTLALLASMLVMAAPVAALTVPTVTLTEDKDVVSLATKYTIEFTVAVGLSADSSSITVTFPDDTAVKETVWADGDITVGGTGVVGTTVTVADVTTPIVGRAVTFLTPVVVPAASTATVVFTDAAGIKNPSTADTYNLWVRTDAEAVDVKSEDYIIIAAPGPVDSYNAANVYQESHSTIQEAIDDADTVAGWTLKVHADTYTENVIIDKDITLESYDGAAATTIDASAEGVAAAVEIQAGGVTLGGDGLGFTIIAIDYSSANAFFNPTGVHLTGGVDDVTIEGNVISGGDLSPQLGIQIGNDGEDAEYSNIQILKNDLDTTWDVSYSGGDPTNPTCGGIKSWPAGTLAVILIDDNDITGFSVGMNLRNLQGESSLLSAIISNNTVNGNDFNGIEVSGDLDFVEIRGNDIYDNGGNGVAISGGEVANVEVEQNNIYNNGNGIKVYDGVVNVTDGISINYNDIYNNTNTTVADRTDLPIAWTWAVYHNYGVFNDAATSNLDAKYNFWSDPSATPLDSSGPSSATYAADDVDDWWAGTALGTGDIAGAVVNSTVLYDPWLTEPQATVIASGKRSYGSDALLLEKGWNTLSVPCGLKGSADTFGEIELLGAFLTAANSDIGYSYDALANDWVLIDPSTELEPGKGFYILMKAASRFPVLYFDGFLDLPAYDMYEGWNLIGSAFGIDKVDLGDGDDLGNEDAGDYGVATLDVDGSLDTTGDDLESLMDKDTALDSISVGASVVVSPSVPGQLIAWAEVTGADANVMLVGEAYWVFMTANGTLAGFEVAPFCFEPGVIPTP